MYGVNHFSVQFTVGGWVQLFLKSFLSRRLGIQCLVNIVFAVMQKICAEAGAYLWLVFCFVLS